MIRKLLIFLAAQLLVSAGFAQQPLSEEQLFQSGSDHLTDRFSAAVAEGDYAEAEQCCLELIRLYDALGEGLRKKYERLPAGHYYNLACCRALQGKRRAAVKSFVQACELGFDDYAQVKNDADLDNIRADGTFRRHHEAMRATSDYLHILRTAADYVPEQFTDTLFRWRYAAPNDRNLVRVRTRFNLDSVAGAGDELSKIRRILTFVHDRIRHDGQRENPTTMNAVSFDEACRDGSRGLNCRGLATVLNEFYLAMGFRSRMVTCMPRVYIDDCHVISTVYSVTLDKWLYVDPTQNAWVMDEHGTMLSIGEVRERLRDGRPLQLNEEANWNNVRKADIRDYLYRYMAKNLYCIYCSDRSEFDLETPAEGKIYPKYAALCPADFTPDYPHSRFHCTTADAGWFWQSPYGD